jgi:hypothetical protein
MLNKKRLLFITLIAASLLLSVWPAQAAEGVRTALTAGKSELTVGDPVDLTLDVTHPAGYQVIIPRLESTWGNFEVRSQGPTETTPNADGTETTRQTISVTLYRPGTFETPALPFSLTSADGQVLDDAAAPVSLTVSPVLAEGDSTLNDIRPQADMPLPLPWPALAGGLAALATVAAGGWWLFNRRRTVDNRPPFQVALDELARIEKLGLPEQGRFKEYYSLITDTLRVYLEKQFEINATDRTTTELKQNLGYTSLAAEQTRALLDLFFDADLVKFAKVVPEPQEAQQLGAGARRFVEQTRPRPQPDKSGPRNQKIDTTHHVEVAR